MSRSNAMHAATRGSLATFAGRTGKVHLSWPCSSVLRVMVTPPGWATWKYMSSSLGMNMMKSYEIVWNPQWEKCYQTTHQMVISQDFWWRAEHEACYILLLPFANWRIIRGQAECDWFIKPGFQHTLWCICTLAAGWGCCPGRTLNMSIAPIELICQVRTLHEIGSWSNNVASLTNCGIDA